MPQSRARLCKCPGPNRSPAPPGSGKPQQFTRAELVRNKTFTCVRRASEPLKSGTEPGGEWPFADVPLTFQVSFPSEFRIGVSNFNADDVFTPPSDWVAVIDCHEAGALNDVSGYGPGVRKSEIRLTIEAVEELTGKPIVFELPTSESSPGAPVASKEHPYNVVPGSTVRHPVIPGARYEYTFATTYYVPGYRCHYTYDYVVKIVRQAGPATMTGVDFGEEIEVTSPGMSPPSSVNKDSYVVSWPWSQYVLDAHLSIDPNLPEGLKKLTWQLGAVYYPSGFPGIHYVGKPEWENGSSLVLDGGVSKGFSHLVNNPSSSSTGDRHVAWLMETSEMRARGSIRARARAMLPYKYDRGSSNPYSDCNILIQDGRDSVFVVICDGPTDGAVVYPVSESTETFLVPRSLTDAETFQSNDVESPGTVYAGYRLRDDYLVASGVSVTGPPYTSAGSDGVPAASFRFLLPSNRSAETWHVTGMLRLNDGNSAVAEFMERVASYYASVYPGMKDITDRWTVNEYVGVTQTIVLFPIAAAAFGWLTGKAEKSALADPYVKTLQSPDNARIVVASSGGAQYAHTARLKIWEPSGGTSWEPYLEDGNRRQLLNSPVSFPVGSESTPTVRIGSSEYQIAPPSGQTKTASSEFAIRLSTQRGAGTQHQVVRGLPTTLPLERTAEPPPGWHSTIHSSSSRAFETDDVVMLITGDDQGAGAVRSVRVDGRLVGVAPGHRLTAVFQPSPSASPISSVFIDPLKPRNDDSEAWYTAADENRLRAGVADPGFLSVGFSWQGAFAAIDVYLTPAWPNLRGAQWDSSEGVAGQREWKSDSSRSWTTPMCTPLEEHLEPNCVVIRQDVTRGGWSATVAESGGRGVSFGDQRGGESHAHLYLYRVGSRLSSDAMHAMFVRSSFAVLPSTHANGNACVQYGAVIAPADPHASNSKMALPPRGVAIIPGTGRASRVLLKDNGDASVADDGARPFPARVTAIAWTLSVSQSYWTASATNYRTGKALLTVTGIYDGVGRPLNSKYGWTWNGMWPRRSPAVFQAFPVKDGSAGGHDEYRSQLADNTVPLNANSGFGPVGAGTSLEEKPQYEWFNKTLFLPAAFGGTGNIPSAVTVPLAGLGTRYVPATSSTVECAVHLNGAAPSADVLKDRALSTLNGVLAKLSPPFGPSMTSATIDPVSSTSRKIVFTASAALSRTDRAIVRRVILESLSAELAKGPTPLQLYVSVFGPGFYDGINVDGEPLYDVISLMYRGGFPGDAAFFPPFGTGTQYTRQPTGIGMFLKSGNQSLYVPGPSVVLVREAPDGSWPLSGATSGTAKGRAMYGPHFGPLVSAPTSASAQTAAEYAARCITIHHEGGSGAEAFPADTFALPPGVPGVELTFRDVKSALSASWKGSDAATLIPEINAALKKTSLALALPQLWNGYPAYQRPGSGELATYKGGLYYGQTGGVPTPGSPESCVGNATLPESGSFDSLTYNQLTAGQSAPTNQVSPYATYSYDDGKFVVEAGVGGDGQRIAPPWSVCSEALEVDGSSLPDDEALLEGAPNISLITGRMFYEDSGAYSVAWDHTANEPMGQVLDHAFDTDDGRGFSPGIAILMRTEDAAWRLATDSSAAPVNPPPPPPRRADHRLSDNLAQLEHYVWKSSNNSLRANWSNFEFSCWVMLRALGGGGQMPDTSPEPGKTNVQRLFQWLYEIGGTGDCTHSSAGLPIPANNHANLPDLIKTGMSILESPTERYSISEISSYKVRIEKLINESYDGGYTAPPQSQYPAAAPNEWFKGNGQSWWTYPNNWTYATVANMYGNQMIEAMRRVVGLLDKRLEIFRDAPGPGG